MTTSTTDRSLKQKHRALWASGDYPAVAAELIPDLGPALVAACGAVTLLYAVGWGLIAARRGNEPEPRTVST